MKISLILMAVLTTASVTAQATSFDCVAPEFPQRSTSNEGVRRVQKQIKSWRDCYALHDAAGQPTPDAQRLNADVDTEIQKWVDATRAYSSRNAINDSILAHIERERTIYLRTAPPR